MNTVNLTLTQEQFEMVKTFFAEAEATAHRVSDWTGETAEEIEAKFAIPHPSIEFDMWLEDRADWEAAQRMGFSFS